MDRLGITEPASASVIWGESAHPFYIVSPPYLRTSAGVRVLHHLCNMLNRAGYPAFMIMRPRSWGVDLVKPGLITPLLTKEIAASHFRNRLTPVTIYPEVVAGNPYRAPFVVRFLGYYPGELGGPRRFDEDDVIVPYSQALVQPIPAAEEPLFIPVSDPRIFKPPPPGGKRTLRLVYGDKFKKIHGGRFRPEHSNLLEILRDQPGQQSQEEVVSLLQRAEVLYVYENTALAHEAVLCGCVCVLVYNDYFRENLAQSELGGLGIVTSDDEASLQKARGELEAARQRYQAQLEKACERVERFAKKMTARAHALPYRRMVRSPSAMTSACLATAMYTRAFFFYLRKRGIGYTMKRTFAVLRRRFVRT